MSERWAGSAWIAAAMLATASCAGQNGMEGVSQAGAANVPAAGTVAASSGSAACPPPAELIGGTRGIEATVRYLSDDRLEGRLAGSEGERCAGDYIAERMRSIGLEPAGTSGYFAEVPLASVVNPHAPDGRGRNVIGALGPHDAPVVVIGAHYDHLGMGGFGSMAPGETAVHNGADDNASGVAAMLEVAQRLAQDPPAVRVVFVAFTGEEFGLLGSAHYANDPAVPLERTQAMINMDMVGRLADQPLIVYGVGTAEQWPSLLREAAAPLGIQLAERQEGYGPSDHTSFYARDVPVLHLFTNVHGEYHSPEDDWHLIDFEGIARVASLVEDVVRDVAAQPHGMTLVRGAGAPPSAEGNSGYGTYLGTVPDFTPVEHGVLLSGVSGGSPAETAGFRAGDILIRMGDAEIADLYALTDALRAHKPGDVVDVTVVRDGEELTRTLMLESRASRSVVE